MNPYLATGAMTTAAAVVGSLGTSPDSSWYRALDKPSWQPPPVAFPLVWTPLYASIAWATGRAAAASPSGQRRMLAVTGVDLVANASWNWAFFAARSPVAGLGVIGVLNVANVALLREAAARDKVAGAALTPYAVWCGFATALNYALWRRNR